MAKPSGYLTEKQHPKTLLLATYYAPECQLDYEHFVAEFLSLCTTAKIPCEHVERVKMRQIASAHFLTKGKLSELVVLCQSQEFKQVICALQLSPLQKRNMEDATNCQIMDRSDLILEIFRTAATSAEGRLQVKMAEIELLKTRISGVGEELSQQQSGAMARGPGETYKEYAKRFYKRVFAQAKKELDQLQKTRQTQRDKRIQSGKSIFAIVGYTNAGKSSLINALTGSTTLVEDKLFATLDTTTKTLFVTPKCQILISDTIGFISNIPHNLIAAFKSTLDELQYADGLLHVIDSSNSAWPDQVHVVNQTLAEIGVVKPMVFVFNKIDRLTPEQKQQLEEQLGLSDMQPHVFVSATEKENFTALKQLISNSVKNKQAHSKT